MPLRPPARRRSSKSPANGTGDLPSWQCRASPRLELFLAAWSLASDRAQRHPEWRRQGRRALPGTYWAAEAALGGNPEIWLLAAAAPGATPADSTAIELLARIERRPAGAVLTAMLASLLGDPALARRVAIGGLTLPRALASLPRPRLLALSSMNFEPSNPDSPLWASLARFVAVPASGQRALVAGLDAFREAVFEPLWRRLQEAEAAAAQAVTTAIARGDWDGLGHRLGLGIEFDRKAGAIRQVTGGARTDMAQIDSLQFLPSSFNEPRWWFIEQKGERGTAWLPFLDPKLGPEPQRAAADEVPPAISAEARRGPGAALPAAGGDVALVFRALGDATRFAMANLLARRAMPAVELARQLHLSKPTVTHHLHFLREAGLIEEQGEGGRRLLALRREALEALSSRTLRRLFEAEPVPPARSRRRPG
jgi:DNA-binding transcriptional ArsR family regulator